MDAVNIFMKLTYQQLFCIVEQLNTKSHTILSKNHSKHSILWGALYCGFYPDELEDIVKFDNDDYFKFINNSDFNEKIKQAYKNITFDDTTATIYLEDSNVEEYARNIAAEITLDGKIKDIQNLLNIVANPDKIIQIAHDFDCTYNMSPSNKRTQSTNS